MTLVQDRKKGRKQKEPPRLTDRGRQAKQPQIATSRERERGRERVGERERKREKERERERKRLNYLKNLRYAEDAFHDSLLAVPISIRQVAVQTPQVKWNHAHHGQPQQQHVPCLPCLQPHTMIYFRRVYKNFYDRVWIMDA